MLPTVSWQSGAKEIRRWRELGQRRKKDWRDRAERDMKVALSFISSQGQRNVRFP